MTAASMSGMLVEPVTLADFEAWLPGGQAIMTCEVESSRELGEDGRRHKVYFYEEDVVEPPETTDD